MAGPFPLHKHITSEFQQYQSSWKDGLKQIQCSGPEFASYVSTLESLVALLDRERSLLTKLTWSRNHQMRTFHFWQVTKQIVGYLKAIDFGPSISMLQQLHLQLSQGRKTKPTVIPGFVQAFTLHQLRSTYVMCMSICGLMQRGYELYGSMIILSHLMPISLALMAVFSRLTILISRAAHVCSSAYNAFTDFCDTDPEKLSEFAQWDVLVGRIERSLEIPDNVQWEALSKQMSIKDEENQKEIDKLNLQLQRKAEEDDDDLGEELDEALVYRPSPAPIAAKPSTTKQEVVKKPSAPPSKSYEKSENKASSASSTSTSREEKKERTSEKPKDKSLGKDKPKERLKEKPKSMSDDDEFELLWQAPKDSGHQKKKDKESGKHKDKSSGHKSEKHSDESKKRKKQVAAASDEIDDLFGLLTPSSKKSKH